MLRHGLVVAAVQRLLARDQYLALERLLVGERRDRHDDGLPDHRHGLDHVLAEAGQVGRHIAPAQDTHALLGEEFLEIADGEVARRFVLGQEAHRDRVLSRPRQIELPLLRPVPQQQVRNLDQAARAVAHQRVGADRAAMVEIDQNLQALTDDVVRLHALHMRDEADAARIVLVPRVVQSLFRGQFHA